MVVIHPDGFLATTLEGLRGKAEVLLPRWGGIEGVLMEGAARCSGGRVLLSSGQIPLTPWHLLLIAEADAAGRFSLPWQQDLQLLVLQSTGTPPSPPNIEYFASITAFERARDQWYGVRRDHELAHRAYQLRVAADGSFNVDRRGLSRAEAGSGKRRASAALSWWAVRRPLPGAHHGPPATPSPARSPRVG